MQIPSFLRRRVVRDRHGDGRLPASKAGGANRTDSESTAADGVRRVRWSISIVAYRNSRQRTRRVGAGRSHRRHVHADARRRIVRRRQLRIGRRRGATHDCRAFDTATTYSSARQTVPLPIDNSTRSVGSSRPADHNSPLCAYHSAYSSTGNAQLSLNNGHLLNPFSLSFAGPDLSGSRGRSFGQMPFLTLTDN